MDRWVAWGSGRRLLMAAAAAAVWAMVLLPLELQLPLTHALPSNGRSSLFSQSQSQRESADLQRWKLRKEQKQRARLARNTTSATQRGYTRLKALNDRLGEEHNYYANISLAEPLKLLSRFIFPGPTIPMTTNEFTGKAKCSFLGADCPMEKVEHALVNRFLTPGDVVLEVGARFGTTSCAIASKQNNSGHLVVVEPDSSVWHLLAHNQHRHHCSFWALRGVVSNRAHSVSPHSYGTRSQLDARGSGSFFSFLALQNATGERFTALLIDCEGCIEALFLEGAQTVVELNTLRLSLSSVATIILEADMSDTALDCYLNCVNYQTWVDRLRSIGFAKVHHEADPVFSSIAHYVFQRQARI